MAGPADSHCTAAQPVSAASCHVIDAGTPADDDSDAGADAGQEEDCDYGSPLFGNEGDDDDCKYHLVWSSTPLCEGSPGVTVTVKITEKATGAAVTGVANGVLPEAYIPSDPNAACSTGTHVSPSSDRLVETPANSGTYVGNVIFDQSGQWVVRFHIHEECADVLETSPHGHAAFRFNIP
jgi:hypothetical protein